MNLQKLNPWNWFKHEETSGSDERVIPVKRDENTAKLPAAYESVASPMMRLHQDIDRLFDEVFRGFGFAAPRLSAAANWPESGMIRPRLNISSDDSTYKISLEVPGLKESDISVEVKNDVLTIQGEINEEKEDKDRHFYRVERSYGSFQRTLALPDDANADEIQATMKDGVLNLLIPRRDVVDAEVKKVPIRQS